MSASTAPANVYTIGIDPDYMLVELSDITFDLRVQRTEGADQRRVDKYANNFDPNALGLVILSRRSDGSLVCLDGMHRVLVARQVGHNHPVQARVFRDLTLAEEASLFLLYNDKKDPSAISKFNARVIAGDPAAVEINQIAQAHGWRIRQSKEAGCVAAIDAVEKVYLSGAGAKSKGANPELLNRVFSTITEAWGTDGRGAHQSILGGLGQLFARFGESVDQRRLVTVLQSTTPSTLVSNARALRDFQGGTTNSALAKALVSAHNKNRRTNLLPEWVWTR